MKTVSITEARAQIQAWARDPSEPVCVTRVGTPTLVVLPLPRGYREHPSAAALLLLATCNDTGDPWINAIATHVNGCASCRRLTDAIAAQERTS